MISFLFSVKVSHVIEAPVVYTLAYVAAGLIIYVCFNELLWWAGRIIEYDTPSKLLENESSEFSRLIKEYSRRSHGFSGTANNWMATREWIQDGESRYESWLPHNIISIYDKQEPKPHGAGFTREGASVIKMIQQIGVMQCTIVYCRFGTWLKWGKDNLVAIPYKLCTEMNTEVGLIHA